MTRALKKALGNRLCSLPAFDPFFVDVRCMMTGVILVTIECYDAVL